MLEKFELPLLRRGVVALAQMHTSRRRNFIGTVCGGSVTPAPSCSSRRLCRAVAVALVLGPSSDSPCTEKELRSTTVIGATPFGLFSGTSFGVPAVLSVKGIAQL